MNEIATMPALAALLHPYKMTSADKHRLALLLAHAYLTAKYAAYQRAAQTAAPYVRLRSPWKPSHHDAQQALQRATTQVDGIAATYESLLEHAVADLLGHERGIGDFFGKVKDIVSAVGDWFRDFIGWKSDQIANATEGEGDTDGTMAWVENAGDDPSVQDVSMLMIEVYPGESNNDVCAQYAGQTFPLSAADSVPAFPIHPNCRHRVRIVATGGA